MFAALEGILGHFIVDGLIPGLPWQLRALGVCMRLGLWVGWPPARALALLAVRVARGQLGPGHPSLDVQDVPV